MRYFQIIFVCVLLLSINAYASDLAKEKRWADQVVDAIIDGDAVWLNDGKSDFLGIYTEAEEASTQSAIIMHGTGVHPDWQQVVQPLRVGLTEYGWNTLSIQMPILSNDAKHEDYAPLYDEVAPRIDAAIAYLKDNGAKKLVLIGHSQGAAMAAYYLAGSKQDVNGFVAIGMPGNAEDVRMSGVRSLEKIKIPVLDLYGDEDLEAVLASTGSRHAAAQKAGNQNYIQKEIHGNHFYDGNDEGLVAAVSVWLKALK